jgi:hypothetical protein
MAFNWIGYQGLTHFLQKRANVQMQTQIDAGAYDEASLVELSVPMNLPYTTNWQGWESFEGDIEIDGIHYRYVQRKLENGRMFVRCLPNIEKQQVMNARDAFFKLANSIGKSSEHNQNSAPVYISNYIGDYDDHWHQPLVCPPPAEAGLSFSGHRHEKLPLSFPSDLIKPPCFLG